MQVQVKLFAVARDLAGCSTTELTLPKAATVADVRTALAQAHPALAPLLPAMLIAINHEYATDTTPVAPTQEIALIPPVSGG